MNIRTKLTARFFTITAVIMLAALVTIYLLYSDYRRENFHERLTTKGKSTAKLLVEVKEVSPELLYSIEKSNTLSLPNEKIIIYTNGGKQLFNTDYEQVLHVTRELLDEIRAKGTVRFSHDAYEIVGFVHSTANENFLVITGAVDLYGRNKLRNLSYILFFVYLASIGTVLIAAWFFAGVALRPISAVVDQVGKISYMRMNLRVNEGNGKDEIALLAKTFNRMLSRLESSFVAQKNFVANASHELRTPLTAITGQLEVALLNSRSPLDYRKVMLSVLEDIKDLNALSDKLLLLAQISGEDHRHTARVRVDELLWQAREDLQFRDKSFVINIDLDQIEDENALTIKGDHTLLLIAISNVMENGCKYSKDHTISVHLSTDSAVIKITFTDNGMGVPEKDIANIFDPFFRGSNATAIAGHGIGLSMVRNIVMMHAGNIHLTSAQGKGTVITMEFPVAGELLQVVEPQGVQAAHDN